MLVLSTLAAMLRDWPATVLLCGAALAAPLLFVFDPAASALFPPCPVRLLTGWLCPGCGTLRAAHQLLHGNVAAAWALNPLLVGVSPLLLAVLAGQARSEVTGRVQPAFFASPGSAWALLSLTLAYGIARNTAVWPQ
jgi:hypothetical protein